MSIVILKAKLAKPKKKKQLHKDLVISYEETTVEGKAYHEGVRFTFPPHEDLLNAFAKLGVHIANLTCQYNEKGEIDDKSIEARGYALRGEDDKEGITLTGQRTLPDDRQINLNTPYRTWGLMEAYTESVQLQVDIDVCDSEVTAYLNGKRGEVPKEGLFAEQQEAA